MTTFNTLKTLALSATVATAGVIAATVPAYAEYPERPITLIVPWGAGGGTDATGRMIAGLLQDELGQPVNVVNRTGGSGVVGTRPSQQQSLTATPSVWSQLKLA